MLPRESDTVNVFIIDNIQLLKERGVWKFAEWNEVTLYNENSQNKKKQEEVRRLSIYEKFNMKSKWNVPKKRTRWKKKKNSLVSEQVTVTFTVFKFLNSFSIAKKNENGKLIERLYILR